VSDAIADLQRRIDELKADDAGRPRLRIGQHGNINRRYLGGGVWGASCRFRDSDGVVRKVQRLGLPTSSTSAASWRGRTHRSVGRTPCAFARPDQPGTLLLSW